MLDITEQSEYVTDSQVLNKNIKLYEIEIHKTPTLVNCYVRT